MTKIPILALFLRLYIPLTILSVLLGVLSLSGGWKWGSDVITFISSREGNYKIYVTDLARHWTRKLNDHPVRYQFSLSPQGESIAFSAFGSRAEPAAMYVMTSTGGHLRAVLPLAGNNVVNHLIWSPDGEWLAFQVRRREVSSRLEIVRADGSQQYRLTDDIFTNISPA